MHRALTLWIWKTSCTTIKVHCSYDCVALYPEQHCFHCVFVALQAHPSYKDGSMPTEALCKDCLGELCEWKNVGLIVILNGLQSSELCDTCFGKLQKWQITRVCVSQSEQADCWFTLCDAGLVSFSLQAKDKVLHTVFWKLQLECVLSEQQWCLLVESSHLTPCWTKN